MKISEFIQELREAQLKYGNIEILTWMRETEGNAVEPVLTYCEDKKNKHLSVIAIDPLMEF